MNFKIICNYSNFDHAGSSFGTERRSKNWCLRWGERIFWSWYNVITKSPRQPRWPMSNQHEVRSKRPSLDPNAPLYRPTYTPQRAKARKRLEAVR
jgi:hypothetical protein